MDFERKAQRHRMLHEKMVQNLLVSILQELRGMRDNVTPEEMQLMKEVAERHNKMLDERNEIEDHFTKYWNSKEEG